MNDITLKQLGKPSNPMETEVLDFLISCADEEISDNIIRKKLTLKKCIDSCFDKGHKFEIKNGNRGYAPITPEQHWKWVREYFGIKTDKSDKVMQFVPATESPVPESPSVSGAVDFGGLFDLD